LFCAVSAIYSIKIRLITGANFTIWMSFQQILNIFCLLFLSGVDINDSWIWRIWNIAVNVLFVLAHFFSVQNTVTNVTLFSLYVKILLFFALYTVCEVWVFSWLTHNKNRVRVVLYLFYYLLVVCSNWLVFGSHQSCCLVWYVNDFPFIALVSSIIVYLSFLACTAFFSICVEYLKGFLTINAGYSVEVRIRLVAVWSYCIA
jgi:hypothetical protein